MAWTKIVSTLTIKKSLVVFGMIFLIAIVCEIIFFASLSRHHLPRNYRNMTMVQNQFTVKDIRNSTKFLREVNRTKINSTTFSSIGKIFSLNVKENKNGSFLTVENASDLNIPSPTQIRQDNCSNCFPHDFHFVLDNEHICDKYHGSFKAEIDLLIMIFTTHKNKENRDAIRETWITLSKNNTSNIRYVFLLGNSNVTKLNRAVMEENEIHKDLLQENFTDSYYNLTYKTLMGFKWAVTHCANTKFVLKTDDDMYVNVPYLLNVTLKHAHELQSAVGGKCFVGNSKPIRDRKSKWYASNASYPRAYYPGFCSGTGYVTSIYVVKKILEVSINVPFFHLEDIYVSLCIKQLGYRLLPLPGFNSMRVKIDNCYYKSRYVLTSHEIPPSLLRTLWNQKCIPRSNAGLRIFGFVFIFIFFFFMLVIWIAQ